MDDFKVGEIVYDVNAKCLGEVQKLVQLSSVEVKTLKGQNTYFIHSTCLLNLQDALVKLEEEISNSLNLIEEIKKYV